jgi:SAM-dependent methyltransferase
MLKPLLHSIVARPMAYDAVQFLAGASVVRRRMATAVARLGPIRRVLDVGGGTGAGREVVPAGATYVCVDIDPMKIAGFVRKNPGSLAVVGDATRMPLGDGSVDAMILMFVAHHLDDDLLDRFLPEAARVLGPNGRLVFTDPVWAPRRWIGRLLWRYDRGSFPRTPDRLRQALERRFEIEHWEEFAVWHRYVLAVARPSAVR